MPKGPKDVAGSSAQPRESQPQSRALFGPLLRALGGSLEALWTVRALDVESLGHCGHWKKAAFGATSEGIAVGISVGNTSKRTLLGTQETEDIGVSMSFGHVRKSMPLVGGTWPPTSASRWTAPSQSRALFH